MSEPVPPIMETREEDGLLFGCLLDGEGGGRLVDWAEAEAWTADKGVLWVHLDRTTPRVRQWLDSQNELDPSVIEALLAEETRPRVFHHKAGVTTVLRGINTNPDSDPEDMVAIRIWCDGRRLISLRHRRLMTPRDVLTRLLVHGNGPCSASELFERLVGRLTERISDAIDDLDERLDRIEAESEAEQVNIPATRAALKTFRHDTIVLRRYLAPQREALSMLLLEPPAWLEQNSRFAIRETVDLTQRYVEELDTDREQALLIKDDIMSELSERTNRNIYVLSIIAAVFLPLGFLTGLLGINVGGMPGAQTQTAFWIVTALLIAIGVGEIAILWWLGWFSYGPNRQRGPRSDED